ncbi:venom peptide SjAPI-like [Belonocnema kinseyi]|uniref:venom peptide SjAPI-like n=1 Tax=Belonocnema kinseyi TaxID=2817044 RepID=UPI00143DAA25|nr:venom peptide SjAPI-like [Belonocnema kinseyi]
MSKIFALLFFVSIATVVKSYTYMRGHLLQPEDSACGKYGIYQFCGSACWSQCSSYNPDSEESCLAVCGPGRCQCYDGYIIDDEADNKCVLPQDCKRNSTNKKNHKKS